MRVPFVFMFSIILMDTNLKTLITASTLAFLCLSSPQKGLSEANKSNRLTTHSKASPLSKDAITSDWPRFNGPEDNAKSHETKLMEKWPEDGPKLLWDLEKGEGYASPAIKEGKLILFHRIDEKEIIEAIDSEKGTSLWKHEYPVEYQDRFGYSNGPRASPVIKDNLVYAHGVTAWLSCLDLRTGSKIWQRNLAKEFEIPQYFFGKGSSPLVLGDKLIVNAGGSKNRCVIAFDRLTGATKWITKDAWGASYSSPTKTMINGKEVCLVFTGGESRPPEGGLLVIDPKDGKKLARFPWRASGYESANAVPPIPAGENRVFLSECYEKGGVMLKFDKEFNPSVLWTDKTINVHWMTPILSGKAIYGVAGRHQQGADVFCINADSGKPYWRDRLNWTQDINGRTTRLELFRGSLLKLSDHYLCLSEFGSLLRVKLDEKGWKIEEKSQLFFAPGTWTLPALSKGLLYVMQNETDRLHGHQPRLLCYDFRLK